MKRGLFFLILAVLASRCDAQWAVVDIANLQQNITNYAVMVQQIAKQGEQIANQVQQIQQMEDQLKRMGNMADVKAVVGFPSLRLDLTLPTRIRAWVDGSGLIDGARFFGDTRGGVYPAVPAEVVDFDGVAMARDPDAYKPTEEITAKVDEFKDVQADAYTRRAALKAAIAQTSNALQAAGTEAEEQKLSAVLDTQYRELAFLDSEVQLSAAEIQVRAAETNAMTSAETQADAEARRKLAQSEAKKIGATFRPAYDSVLRYVSEQPFQR